MYPFFNSGFIEKDHVILCHANTLTQLQNTTLIYKLNSGY